MTLPEELRPGIDPLGQKTILCISVRPLTGCLGGSGARGFFAPEMRWAGCHRIVFTGASDRWVYLFIANDDVELWDASHLAGVDITETTVRLRRGLRTDIRRMVEDYHRGKG